MSNENRVRALLDAAARTDHVDEQRLWREFEARLDARQSRPPRRIVPVAAAAAAALVIGGTAAWVSASTAPSPAPVGPAGAPTTTAPSATSTPTTTAPSATSTPTTTAPSATSTPTSEPAPTPTSTPPASSTTPPPQAPSVPPLSKEDTLTAADYASVGWTLDSVGVGQGMGQAASSRCESDIFWQVDPVSIFTAAGYHPAGGAWANQRVAQLTAGDARTLTDGILTWPSTCDQDKVAGALHRVSVPGADQASWYTIGYGPDQGEELIAVVRAGDRVSLVVLGTSGSALTDVDTDRLLTVMAQRLT